MAARFLSGSPMIHSGAQTAFREWRHDLHCPSAGGEVRGRNGVLVMTG
jgi:hypothetical protein